MICDWFAACRVYEKQSNDIFEKEYEWWCGKKDKMKLHQDTKILVERALQYLSDYRTPLLTNSLGFGTYTKDERKALKSLRHHLKSWKPLYENSTQKLSSWHDYCS